MRLREQFDIDPETVVIGSSGFIQAGREFVEIVELLGKAEDELRQANKIERSWQIDIVSCRHWRHKDAPLNPLAAAERDLSNVSRENFRYGTDLLLQSEMNARLQVCDLLWSWTRLPSMAYGSGTASDQYCSGTRLVVPKKRQMSHLFDLPNVVIAPDDLEGFVDTLVEEAQATEFSRHDPSPLSWEKCIGPAAEFLNLVWRGASQRGQSLDKVSLKK